MSKFKRNSKITILEKERLVNDLLNTLVYYPANKVLSFFDDINLSLPRELRINVLRRVLRDPVIKTREERHSLADEMNYRLSWFNQYSELQLVNLFGFYKDNDLNKLYLEELWLDIINYVTDIRISEEDFDKLISSSINYVKKEGLVLPDIIKYNDSLDPLFYDKKNEIDGLKLDVIRPVLYKSSTLTEIRKLGRKYGVNVPTRLRKNELIEIVLDELKERDEYSIEQEQKIRKMSVLLIQRFAKNNDIKASTELKKEEVIEYILSNAKETKESYFVPSSSIYELEASDIGEVMPDPVVEKEQESVDEKTEEVLEDIEEIEKREVVEKENIENEQVEETKVEITKIEEELTEIEPKKEKQSKKTLSESEMDILRENITFQELDIGEHMLDIDKTIISAVKYRGKNNKKIAKGLRQNEEERLDTILVDNRLQKINDYNNEVVAVKKKSPAKTIFKFILVVILILIVLFLIYGALRPVGGYSKLANVDKIFNKLKIGSKGMLDWYTDFVRRVVNKLFTFF